MFILLHLCAEEIVYYIRSHYWQPPFLLLSATSITYFDTFTILWSNATLYCFFLITFYIWSSLGGRASHRWSNSFGPSFGLCYPYAATTLLFYWSLSSPNLLSFYFRALLLQQINHPLCWHFVTNFNRRHKLGPFFFFLLFSPLTITLLCLRSLSFLFISSLSFDYFFSLLFIRLISAFSSISPPLSLPSVYLTLLFPLDSLQSFNGQSCVRVYLLGFSAITFCFSILSTLLRYYSCNVYHVSTTAATAAAPSSSASAQSSDAWYQYFWESSGICWAYLFSIIIFRF